MLHYFLAMGAQQAETGKAPDGELSFLFGTEKIRVVVLNNQDVIQGNKIISTVLSLASMRNSSQLVYLAAPRLLGASIDASIFRLHGIGLLLFDARRIDETVAPQALQPVTPLQQASQKIDPEIVTELATLKSMYAEMETSITRLREDLNAFQHESEKFPRTQEPTRPSTLLPAEPTFPGATVSNAHLPSFFTNNPWLDVLSKRGRSESEHLAG